MSSVTPSQNPFISGPAPRENETREERSHRERDEARAKAVSDAIDEQIEQDRIAFERYKRAVKVLLFGQSGSGKSTVIKNFQRKYAYDVWVEERNFWKIIIQLNLVRSVTTVLEIVEKATKEQKVRPKSRQRPPSPSISSDNRGPSDDATRDPLFDLSTRHRLLLAELKPLPHIQRNLEEYLDSALEPDQTTSYTAFSSPGAVLFRYPRRVARFSALDDGKTRSSHGERRRPNERKSIQDLRGTMKVLYHCVPCIKQLWADDVIQRVLEVEQQMEHSRFSVGDVDRLLEENYEPSDRDVLEARLRTVGVQEYYFSIPGYKQIEDWILYDVSGWNTFRHVWRSYDINSIIFLAPVSCFDQYLDEDPSVNRLNDSVRIWKQVCNSKLLVNVQLVLLFNKIDLLGEKLESGIRFANYIVSYGKRPNDVASVTSYLKEKFRVILKDSGNERFFHWHTTSAVDAEMISTTLFTVREGIIRDALKRETII